MVKVVVEVCGDECGVWLWLLVWMGKGLLRVVVSVVGVSWFW
jgi:hypothetical protein